MTIRLDAPSDVATSRTYHSTAAMDRETPKQSIAAERHARDADLIARLRDNDVQALKTLMHLYATPLGAVAYAVLGTNEFVDDVLQDVFIVIWERRMSLEIHDNVAGYLYRAVRNRAQNVLRHERTQYRAESAVLQHTDLPLSASNTAEHSLDDADFKAQVYAALQRVPDGPREVFLLRWEQELSYDEIATMIGKPLPTVRVLMSRATKYLARYVRRHF